jgi:hypothetical protein
VLAQHGGRSGVEFAVAVVENRPRRAFGGTFLRVMHIEERSEVLHLWIVRDVLEAVDRSVWDIVLLEQPFPVPSRGRDEARCQDCTEFLKVRGTFGVAFEPRVLLEFRPSDRSQQALLKFWQRRHVNAHQLFIRASKYKALRAAGTG